MNKIVNAIEKHQSFFEKISKNNYLMAIKDGFITAMPLVLFSSIFLLFSSIPGLMHITLPAAVLAWLSKIYTFTMGVIGLVVAGTVAKSLTGNLNRKMPTGKVINDTSTMVASICAFLFLTITQEPETGSFQIGFMGTQGLMSSFVAAFITVNVYKFCVLKNITIHMPKEVPGAISQAFKDVFPFSFSILICSFVDLITRNYLDAPFAQMLQKVLSPVFKGVESYPGMMLIWFLIAMFWFVGIHGPSIVLPAITAVQIANTDANLQLLNSGQHPYHALTSNFGNYIPGIGGTGATFIVPIILIFFMKSKQLKAIGKTSIIPVMFAVNEPLLFGAPMILNPYFFVPFLMTPVVNVALGKIFIDFLGMSGMVYVLPWALPGPIGILLNTHFQPIAFVFIAVMLTIDFLIYLPFCRGYDNMLVEKEQQELVNEIDADNGEGAESVALETGISAQANAALAVNEQDTELHLDHNVKVLVLCAGSGTSAQLANALNEGAKEHDLPLVANSGAYGSHHEILPGYNVVILAPQVRNYYSDMKEDTDKLGIKLIATKGMEYINLTLDSEGAIKYILSQLSEEGQVATQGM